MKSDRDTRPARRDESAACRISSSAPTPACTLERTTELIRAREMHDSVVENRLENVRGWSVFANDMELVGVVSSILVSLRGRAIRYLGVAVATPSRRAAAPEVLVPIGWIAVAPELRRVTVRALSYSQMLNAPRITNRPVTRADEYATLMAYSHTVGWADDE